MTEHYNPVLVTVLPKERRSRHAYQVATMLLLINLGAYQLWSGPNPKSSVLELDTGAQDMLNWFCILGGVVGLVAAFIPERIVHWRWWRLRFDFDATYWRLFDELGCHLLIVSAWASMFVTFLSGNGWGFGPIVAFYLGAAAVWRAGQILSTLFQAAVFSRRSSMIIGVEDTKKQAHGG